MANCDVDIGAVYSVKKGWETMSKDLIVTHCSPTLAGMKTGSLFSCFCACPRQLRNIVEYWNNELNKRGVYIKIMQYKEARALIYVYRKEQLQRSVNCERIRCFLEKNGYDYSDADKMVDEMLMKLGKRLREGEEFPHEIGVFLGYPFEDVLGFIENKGRNYKHLGLWKVYSDECAAKKLFSKYKKCTDVYCKCFKAGTCLARLAISPACSKKMTKEAASF